MPQILFNTPLGDPAPIDFKDVVLRAARDGSLLLHAFVVPTERRARELARELTRSHYNRTAQPLTHLPIYTLNSFAHTFFERLGTQRRTVSSEVQLLLFESAIKSLDLEYYRSSSGTLPQGIIEGLARVINGVRTDGIMPSDFQRDIAMAIEHSQDEKYARYDLKKLSDLYNIYSVYLRLLGEHWTDYPGKLLGLNTELFRDRDQTLAKGFPELRWLWLDGYTEFTQPELALLSQLGLTSNLNVRIYFDYASENGPLYGNFSEAIEKLRPARYRVEDLDPLQYDIPESERRPFRHHMRRNLFRTDERIPNPGFNDQISVYGFYNRPEEVRGISALVKWLVTEQGLAPERICITTLDMDPYAELFRQNMASHGIPANITARFPLERNALVTALFAAMSIVAGNYDRRDVLRAMTSPYLDFGTDADPAALTEVSGKLRITRGRSTWLRRIEFRIEFLERRLIKVVDDPEDRASITRELRTLHRALRSISAISERLQSFAPDMTPSGFRTALVRLAGTLRSVERVLSLRHELESRPRAAADWQRIHDEIERDTRALAALMRLLDELTEYYQSTPDPDYPDDRRPLEFYLDKLYTACARSGYQLREKHDYGVLITPTREIAGFDMPGFDAVIVCGMVDGEFPSVYVPESFLGKPLEGAEDRRLRRERVEFYHAVTCSNQDHGKLFFTYPRNAGNAELVRSPFLDAFLRITTLEEDKRVWLLDGLDGMQQGLRSQGAALDEALRFLTLIPTHDALAEEAGTALWSNQPVPRINDAEHMLTNLRHTVQVESARLQARAGTLPQGQAGQYRGVIASALNESERQELEKRHQKEYSISQLELYAKCPFKYFASRILRVNAPSGYDVTLTPLERGVLVHAVLFRLYTELRNGDKLPITPLTRDEAVRRARELAAEEISGIQFDHPYWTIDQERLLGGTVFNGLLESWIDAEVQRAEEKTQLVPEFFETGFGGGRGKGDADDGITTQISDAELTRTGPMILHEVSLRGKVDRIELYPNGDELWFAVADYKTGTPPTRTDIREGLSLQLMIYLEAVRSLLAEHFSIPLHKVRPVGGIYYRLDAREVTSEDKYIFVPNQVKNAQVVKTKLYKQDPDTIDDLQLIINDSFRYANQYVDGIASGIFHVTTRDVNKTCRGCEFQTVCRVRA